MNAQIVFDAVKDIINGKIEDLLRRGIIVASYDELLRSMERIGYFNEDEVKKAIVELVRNKQIKTGKTFMGKDADGNDTFKGWLREYREIDKQDDLRPK